MVAAHIAGWARGGDDRSWERQTSIKQILTVECGSAIYDLTVKFLEGGSHRIHYLRFILGSYEHGTGLKINYEKSSVIGINMQDGIVREYAAGMGCKLEKLPIIYLVLPFHFIKFRAADWDTLFQMKQIKLAIWEGRNLSLGVRITLLNAVLSSISHHYISVFQLPKGIIKRIDAI